MRSTRKIIAEFIGVFVIGGVAGCFLTWAYITWYYDDSHITGFMNRTNNPDTMVTRINKKYAEQFKLTPDEINRIQPLINEMAQHTYQIRHQFGVDVLANYDNYHQKIAQQLTPEHRDVYQKATAERKKELTGLLLPDQASPTPTQK